MPQGGETTGLKCPSEISLLVTFEGFPLCVVLGGGPTNGGTQK